MNLRQQHQQRQAQRFHRLQQAFPQMLVMLPATGDRQEDHLRGQRALYSLSGELLKAQRRRKLRILSGTYPQGVPMTVPNGPAEVMDVTFTYSFEHQAAP